MSSINYPDILVVLKIVLFTFVFILSISILKRVVQKQWTTLVPKLSDYLYHKFQEFDKTVTIRPDLLKAVLNIMSNPAKLNTMAIRFPRLYLFSHVYSMRNNNMINDIEWEGWINWMKYSFEEEQTKKQWKQIEQNRLFSLHFIDFINEYILRGKRE